MKNATLAALICTVLLLLYQVFYFVGKFFSTFFEQLSYRATNMVSGALFILFVTSLSYFFLVLYKNQKS